MTLLNQGQVELFFSPLKSGGFLFACFKSQTESLL